MGQIDAKILAAIDATVPSWTMKNRKLRGKEYRFFDRHKLHGHRPYLWLPLADQTRVKCFKKGRQAGVSENSVSEALYLLANHQVNVVYTFPSPKQAEDFSNTRIDTALRETDYMKGLIGNPQNVGLRKIGKGFLFIRSATNEKLGEGIDADATFFDEIDRMRKGVKIAFQESLSSSPYGFEREISTPTLPGRGVDETWQRSSQYHWHVKCEACGEEQRLRYPDNIKQLEEVPVYAKEVPDSAYAYCCSKCGSLKLDRRRGRYIPDFPDRSISGYHVNQMACVWITASQIEAKRRQYKFPQLFWNYVLGECYMADNILITDAVLLNCMSDSALKFWGGRTTPYVRVSAGIDWGFKNWVSLWGLREDGRTDLIGLHVVEDTAEPLGSAKAIAEYMKSFRPDIIVADLGYGKDRVAYLMGVYPGRVYACSYLDDAKTVLPVFSENGFRVSVDRTCWLKGTANQFREGRIVLPGYDKSALIDVLASHLKSLVVMHEEDEETGKLREYVDHTDDDHFAHTTGYALMGLEKVGGSGDFTFDFV